MQIAPTHPQAPFVTGRRRRPALLAAAAAVAVITAGCASPSARPTAADGVPGTSHPAPPAGLTVAATLPVAPGATTPTVAPPSSASRAPSPAPLRRNDPIDERVAIDPAGARLHIRCDGDGPVTIVMIAGFGDGGEAWDAVAPTLAQHTRVCTYARFGTGSSDPPPSVQTFATEANDLHALLHGVGEVGPYLVVGHSFGGAEAVAFTDRFATEVQGLVLLDASPVEWPTAVCAVPDDGSEAAAGFRQTCAMVSDPKGNPEHLAAPDAFAEVATITSLGDVPMVVATAAQHPRPGLDPAVAAHLDEVWSRGQQHWAALSSDSELSSVTDTGHYIQLDRPDVVVDAVLQLATRS
jgi:pimeloyl-ACP methyl ester carboxylesterase